MSNLPFLSKLIERIVATQLLSHIKDGEYGETLQSAYKAGHSVETALLRVQNDMLVSLDKGQSVILILLDLSTAFDTIDHAILLHRLQHRLGISGTVLSWICSYLEGRFQAVCVDGTRSEKVLLKYGVPQGSVLGPILFTLYTLPLGDIVKGFNLGYHIYADDTQLYLAFDPLSDGSIPITVMECCISKIQAWMLQNRLKLNSGKTEMVVISKRSIDPQIQSIKIGEDTILASKCVRNLGARMDCHISMDAQINSITKVASFHLRNIALIKKYLSKKALEALIHAYVTSHLDSNNSLLIGIPTV